MKGRKLGVLGIAFKPNTSDVRESPAVRVIQEVVRAGGRVRAYDPAAMDEARRALPGVEFADDAYDAAAGCDALIIATEWNQFRNLDWERMKAVLRAPVVVDLRNVYEPAPMKALGIAYVGVGR